MEKMFKITNQVLEFVHTGNHDSEKIQIRSALCETKEPEGNYLFQLRMRLYMQPDGYKAYNFHIRNDWREGYVRLNGLYAGAEKFLYDFDFNPPEPEDVDKDGAPKHRTWAVGEIVLSAVRRADHE